MNEKGNDLQVVWVEIGRPIPRYAKRNISLHHTMHSGLKQILLTDSPQILNLAEVIYRQEIPKSDFTREFENQSRLWTVGQQYFWHGTTARFFHLYDLAKSRGMANFVHAETDCVLLNIEALFTRYRELDFKLAFPLQAEGIGCASVLWIKDLEILEKFLAKILSKWQESDYDDMTLLGEFSVERDVFPLPTWPNQSSYSHNIFDAGSVGKYFLGMDARNNRFPFSTRGWVDARKGSIMSYFDNQLTKWSINKVGTQISVSGVYSDYNFEVVNLHIHSKRIPKSPDRLFRILKRGFSPKRGLLWRIGSFDLQVFFERLYSFASRRILRRTSGSDRVFR